MPRVPPHPRTSRGRSLHRGWGLSVATAVGLGLFGCASEKADLTPPKDSMRAFMRQARPPKDDLDCLGISAKANQIEADLGAKQADR
jgi:hypothetical protein